MILSSEEERCRKRVTLEGNVILHCEHTWMKKNARGKANRVSVR